MAVVKSPKNLKRKKRWVKILMQKSHTQLKVREYIPESSINLTNIYRNLKPRKKSNIVVKNAIFFLKKVKYPNPKVKPKSIFRWFYNN